MGRAFFPGANPGKASGPAFALCSLLESQTQTRLEEGPPPEGGTGRLLPFHTFKFPSTGREILAASCSRM